LSSRIGALPFSPRPSASLFFLNELSLAAGRKRIKPRFRGRSLSGSGAMEGSLCFQQSVLFLRFQQVIVFLSVHFSSASLSDMELLSLSSVSSIAIESTSSEEIKDQSVSSSPYPLSPSSSG